MHHILKKWLIELPPLPADKDKSRLFLLIHDPNTHDWGPMHSFTRHVNEAETFDNQHLADNYIKSGAGRDFDKQAKSVEVIVTYALGDSPFKGS